jgi:hypothetical protein
VKEEKKPENEIDDFDSRSDSDSSYMTDSEIIEPPPPV